MAEEINTHVTCGHCKGTGTCKNVNRNDGSVKSCVSCLNNAEWSYTDNIIVKCSICNGTGWIKLK